MAKALAATTIKLTLTQDLGVESITDTASIAPAASETYVTAVYNGTDLSGNEFAQITLSDDGTPSGTSWALHEIAAPWNYEEDI